MIGTSETPERFSGGIASEFIKARVAAFGRANRMLRVCRVCLDREIKARRLVTVSRRAGPPELLDAHRDWCFLCGALAPTLAAVPRISRAGRAA